MPRPARIPDAGLLRHVVSRGTAKMKIFLDDADRYMFLFLLAEVVTEYDLECYDYCLMDNHFHLSIRNQRSNLSAAMQKLKGEYASNWNVKHRRAGHAFEGPFKDQIVQHEKYFLNLTRYIALNPVRAGLVRAPGDWRWSSYRFHAGEDVPPTFLATRRVLEYFKDGDAGARAAYVAHVASLPECEPDAEMFRSRRRVIGDAAFRAAMRASTTAAHPAEASSIVGASAADLSV